MLRIEQLAIRSLLFLPKYCHFNNNNKSSVTPDVTLLTLIFMYVCMLDYAHVFLHVMILPCVV